VVVKEIPLPPSPEQLNQIIQAAAKRGSTRFPVYRAAVLVPAGSTVQYMLNMPSGFVDTRKSPLELTSDLYDPNLTVNIYVDELENRVTPNGLAFTGPINIDFGEFYVKRQWVLMEFINNAGVDATVTFQVQPALLHVSLFEDWYRPIIEYTMDYLSNISQKMGGIRAI